MKDYINKFYLDYLRHFNKKKYLENISENFREAINSMLKDFLTNLFKVWTVIVIVLELSRKNYLNKAWVPIFVLNNEPLINIASYWVAFVYLLIASIVLFGWLWFMVEWCFSFSKLKKFIFIPMWLVFLIFFG